MRIIFFEVQKCVLLNHPKVIITAHNAFNSQEALRKISETTIANIKGFLQVRTINLIS